MVCGTKASTQQWGYVKIIFQASRVLGTHEFGDEYVSSLDDALRRKYFEDFKGRFKARLSHIRAGFTRDAHRESVGIRAKHTGIIKVEYHKDLMGLLEEGMLLAIRNYRALHQNRQRFTLLEVSAIWPSHFGLTGLGDQSYYPLQFEIIEQAVTDWDSTDSSTMMIRISGIPINYDLILAADSDPSFERGFSYPIPAEEAYIVNRGLINLMYNHRIIERIKGVPQKTTANARKDPRLGILKMFEAAQEDIPLYIDFERLVRYHFGIFAFTGGGKSNLASNIMRRLLYHTKDVKIVIFDVASEYPFLLLDVFADPKIPAHIILENQVSDSDQLASSIVRPREFEDDPRVTTGFKALFDRGIVGHLARETLSTRYTYTRILQELDDLVEQSSGRPTYINAITTIQRAVTDFILQQGKNEDEPVSPDFVTFLDTTARAAVGQFKVSDRSQLHAWATTRADAMQPPQSPPAEKSVQSKDAYSLKRIQQLIEGDDRLVCLSIADPMTIKQVVINLTRRLLQARKKRFQVKPYILFHFDEAQEFIPAGASGIDKECSYYVERLLRQGRKYGLGVCVATQRIAHLNTSALQQLHTFFVGTLPRPYDRSVVSSTFLVDQGILEKTLEFGPGEWLLASYIATGMENVPIFLRADNAEAEVNKYLESI
jgi:hypothetical protein